MIVRKHTFDTVHYNHYASIMMNVFFRELCGKVDKHNGILVFFEIYQFKFVFVFICPAYLNI